MLARDNLIVQDFKDVFSSLYLNTNICFDWGCTHADKVSVRSVKAHLYMLVAEKWDFNNLLL